MNKLGNRSISSRWFPPENEFEISAPGRGA